MSPKTKILLLNPFLRSLALVFEAPLELKLPESSFFFFIVPIHHSIFKSDIRAQKGVSVSSFTGQGLAVVLGPAEPVHNTEANRFKSLLGVHQDNRGRRAH